MPDSRSFRSLRFRLLGPILLTALTAAVVVAIAASRLALRWSEAELNARFQSIESTLAESAFPLNSQVIESIADLTQTDLISIGTEGQVRHATVAIPGEGLTSTKRVPGYITRVFAMQRFETRTDGVREVVVLFDEKQVIVGRRQTLVPLLATGLSTIAGLTTVTLFLASRFVGRLGRLKDRVEAVARGDFTSTKSEDPEEEKAAAEEPKDEIGQLRVSVDQMAIQLDRLWGEVNRQQGEKLLHQIASGLAHQLRNRLTGARMAIELHARDCKPRDTEGLRIAIHEMEHSEDYVQRLLVVASGRQGEHQPQVAGTCLEDVRRSMAPVARHLNVELDWCIDNDAEMFRIRDGSAWIAAATNLIDNAMQSGKRIRVEVQVSRGKDPRETTLLLRVSDDGEGVAEHLATELFEPFVTSKPEGIGLGLAVVRRAAESMDGGVTWRRENDWTHFEMTVAE
ncbi:MAG: HAMP domain-containing sensor histidine kinase [Planctomycetota bacterium]